MKILCTLKKISLTAAAALFVSCGNEKNIMSFEAMNTFMTISSYGKKAEKANRAVEKSILELENTLSVTKSESDVYKLNQNACSKLKVKTETAELLSFALDMARKTDGALNPALYPVIREWGFTTGSYRVPGEDVLKKLLKHSDYKNIIIEGNMVRLNDSAAEIDLGAFGKGFAGDKALEVLKENGIESAILDLGGNIQALGAKPDGTDWRVGIKNPWGGNAVCGVSIRNKAVITSGGYERFFEAPDGKRYIHIFDSKTGHPVENEIESVTIVCDSGAYGDALSTGLFAMGLKKAMDFWKAYRDFEMIIITKDKTLVYTAGLKENIKVIYDFSSVLVVE